MYVRFGLPRQLSGRKKPETTVQTGNLGIRGMFSHTDRNFAKFYPSAVIPPKSLG